MGTAETRIGLARLNLVRKNYGDALTQCRTAARSLLDAGSMDFFVLARITEARVHMAQGERDVARFMLDEIQLHAKQSVDRRVDLEMRLLTAHLEQDPLALGRLAKDARSGGDHLYAALAAGQGQ